jgi:hypothetical protein
MTHAMPMVMHQQLQNQLQQQGVGGVVGGVPPGIAGMVTHGPPQTQIRLKVHANGENPAPSGIHHHHHHQSLYHVLHTIP